MCNTLTVWVDNTSNDDWVWVISGISEKKVNYSFEYRHGKTVEPTCFLDKTNNLQFYKTDKRDELSEDKQNDCPVKVLAYLIHCINCPNMFCCELCPTNI